MKGRQEDPWRDRWKPILVWVLVAALAVYVLSYFVGAAALFIRLATYHQAYTPTVTAWKEVVVKPRQVQKLLVTDKETRTYGFALAVLVGCLVIWVGLNLPRNQPQPKASSRYGSHGSGRWSTKEEVIGAFPSQGAGAVLGRIRGPSGWRTVIYPWEGRARNRFLLVIGPPGSGKTSRYTLPNLLHAIRQDRNRSWLITDPKGEIYREMAALLQQSGWKIKVFNLAHPAASDRFNPLDYVRTVEDAFRVANTIIINTSGAMVAGDAFWTNAERSLLACLIWFVKTSLPKDQQHLATVLHLGNAFARKPELMASIFSRKDLDPAARSLYEQVGGLSDKTRDGVFVGFAVRLQLWTSAEIAALTAASDFSFRDLARDRVALFLIFPDHHSTYQALTSMFFDQAFQELIAEADERNGRLKVEVRMMLEEMANIGRIPDLEKRLATIRSRGILVEMVLQTIGQLRALYGDAWGIITGCADTTLVLAANDTETAEWVSKRLGTTTIRTTSISSTATVRGDSSSESQHYTSRALMLPDEVQGQGDYGLGDDELILVHRGMPPARLNKYPVDEFAGQAERVSVSPRTYRGRKERACPLPDPEKLVPEPEKPQWRSPGDS